MILNRQERFLDLRARVVGREVEWLELLACRPGTREHESIVTVDADAKHIQLALLLLGLEPGRPARAEQTDDGQLRFHPPQGPRVELFFVLDEQPDQPIAANQWVVDQTRGETMPGNTWLFTGSAFVEHQQTRYFLAEANGTVASLVNFGDELIGRPTTVSQDGGNDLWTAHTAVIPPLGTRLTLRLQPADASAVRPLGPTDPPKPRP